MNDNKYRDAYKRHCPFGSLGGVVHFLFLVVFQAGIACGIVVGLLYGFLVGLFSMNIDTASMIFTSIGLIVFVLVAGWSIKNHIHYCRQLRENF